MFAPWKAVSFSKGKNRKTEIFFPPSHTDNECKITRLHKLFILFYLIPSPPSLFGVAVAIPISLLFVPQITHVTIKYLNIE
jgi:hypothetical protein